MILVFYIPNNVLLLAACPTGKFLSEFELLVTYKVHHFRFEDGYKMDILTVILLKNIYIAISF